MEPTDVERMETLFETATDCLVRERRRLVDEREAFRAFEQKVSSVRTGTAASTGVALTQRTAASGLGEIREAYESTVMAVPHYAEEYNEPYATNLGNELGPDVATMLTEGRVFDHQHRQAVLQAVSEAQERRTRLLSALDDEHDAFTTTSQELLAIATEVTDITEKPVSSRSFGALEGNYSRLDVLKTSCEELIDQRQSTLVEQRRTLWLSSTGVDVPTYAYTDLDTSYPVVSSAVELLETIEGHQETLVEAISSY